VLKLSEDKKNTEKKLQDENPEVEPDMSTAWGRFMSDKGVPETVPHFLDGLLSQTDPRLKEQLMADYERFFKVSDVFNALMGKIMSTPEGKRQFEKEINKFAARRHMNESAATEGDPGDNQEDT
jgi:hypothetical protein